LLAWYAHPVITARLDAKYKAKVLPWWYATNRLRNLTAWVICIPFCFVEYNFLIFTNQHAYRFVSIISLGGYMEITTVSLFVIASLVARFVFHEKHPITASDIAAFGLLILVEAGMCIF